MSSALKRSKGENFISAYWPEFDHLCHLNGVNSPKVKAHFRQVDKKLAKLWQEARTDDTLLLVTADHGLMDTPKQKGIELNDHPGLNQ
jgi:predicted AlkP superfamily pyrophosphatase or phosphodiesterase